MKVCIEQVKGGFSVYSEDESAEGMAEGMGKGLPEASPQGMPQGAPGAMMGQAEDEAGEQSGAQTVATVEEALQLAGSMLSGGSTPEQDDASADALFQSGFAAAAKQR